MRWTPGGRSDDLEDRRDEGGGGGGVGGVHIGIGGNGDPAHFERGVQEGFLFLGWRPRCHIRAVAQPARSAAGCP
jgi:hypothetical protein